MDIFVKHFEIEMEKIGAAITNFDWEDRQSYSWWLSQTSFFVNHSSRLLSLCAAKFNLDRENLHRRFVAHASEEVGHERLAENDLKALGTQLNKYPELRTTTSFYRNQYYGIDYINPASFLGYVFLLEGMAVRFGDIAGQRVSQAFGPKASTFLKVHSNEDPDHLQQAFKMIELLDPKELQAAVDSLVLSSEGYIEILAEIKDVASAGAQAAA